MASFFTSVVPSYAEDQLSGHLSALSTLPITFPSTPVASSAAVTASPTSLAAKAKSSRALREALNDLTSSKTVSGSKLVSILESLSTDTTTATTHEGDDIAATQGAQGAHGAQGVQAAVEDDPVDAIVRAEVMTRLVTIVWKDVMQTLVEGALALEEEKAWWDANLASRRSVVIYLVQTLPQRIYDAILDASSSGSLPHLTLSSFSLSNLRSALSDLRAHLPQTTSALFRPVARGRSSRGKQSKEGQPQLQLQLPQIQLPEISLDQLSLDQLSLPQLDPEAAITTLVSPFALTRREMLGKRRALVRARDSAAHRIGLLASQGPRWADSASQPTRTDKQTQQEKGVDEPQTRSGTPATHPAALMDEANRVHAALGHVLEIPYSSLATSGAGAGVGSGAAKRSRSDTITPSVSPSSPATPSSLLSILQLHLPRTRSSFNSVLRTHQRPSVFTRFWIPILLAPPAAWVAARALVRNKQWLKEQVKNAKETVKGFVVTWVWEPVEGIAKTLRTGGEGLGVAPTTVESDQASLQRMVLDLGKDYYHLSGPALDELGAKVRTGDMEQVLRVYEKELQSPLKNALMGSLVRTLLIQVQKTKTDLSLSLLSLDHLLRSQQLTFAFVGVAPSFLVLYGIGGWLRAAYRGEKRGQGRRRRYFSRVRDIEQLLITSPDDDRHMSEKDRGLLIVSVSGLRSWAAGLGRNRDAFVEDLRMVEDPSLTRDDKLRVVERIWRCWGVDGRGPR